jgi:RNA polymerase sigma-70 factor, ECF subfamily
MPDPRLDVLACLERVARRDEEAARALVEHCHPLVMRLVRAHRGRSIGEADLAQEVYLKMFVQLHRYEPRDGVPFEHWLSRLTVRTCLDALRAERRRPHGHAAALSPAAEAWLDILRGRQGPPPVDEAMAARELVERLLARLPPADRLVLSLLDLEDRSVAEVSALTGWNGPLVRVRAFRARRRLRAAASELGLGAAPKAKRS